MIVENSHMQEHIFAMVVWSWEDCKEPCFMSPNLKIVYVNWTFAVSYMNPV
jgi:hypothetical protein